MKLVEDSMRAYKSCNRTQAEMQGLKEWEEWYAKYLDARPHWFRLVDDGKLDEAAGLYREVANSGGNEILVENAQWYLRAMKERRELETQLDGLRQRRQALTPKKP